MIDCTTANPSSYSVFSLVRDLNSQTRQLAVWAIVLSVYQFASNAEGGRECIDTDFLLTNQTLVLHPKEWISAVLEGWSKC